MASVGLARAQFIAVAQARRAALMNSLKTLSGKLELVSRIALVAFYGLFGLGFAVVAGVLANIAVDHRKTELISGVLWFLFGFWQLFPILRAGYTNTFDATTLLRFPVSYRTYFFLRCFYGALEPVALVAVLALAGITIGVTIAAPALLPWCVLVVVLIIALNVLITQLVLSWVERWLAQRQTREILGVVFFLLIIGMQMVGPLAKRLETSSNRSHRQITRETVFRIVAVERALPPGLAGYTLSEAQNRDFAQSGYGLTGLAAYGFAMVLLLDIRLRRQYRGENLSESAARRRESGEKTLRVGWSFAGAPLATAAMIEKEVRYLIRSGPMLLTFIMPVFVLLLLGGTSGRQIPSQFVSMSFPLAAAYSLLILTNVVYNTFGGDHAGVQFYFMSPVPLRNVMMGKNVVHTMIFLIELCILWVAVLALRTPPALWVAAATVAAVPFALAIEFSAGNLLSIFFPKKLDFQMMGRQRTAQASGLISLVVHAVVISVCGIVFLAARRFGVALAIPSFLLLDTAAIAVYLFSLRKAEQLALNRRESLVEALCRE